VSTDLSGGGLMFVLSSPFGRGENHAVTPPDRTDARPEKCRFSATTRPIRPGEVHGRDYLFVNQSKFEQMAKRGEFARMGHRVRPSLWHAAGRRSKPPYRQDRTCCFDIDWAGARSKLRGKKRRGADVVSVFHPAAVCRRPGKAPALPPRRIPMMSSADG